VSSRRGTTVRGRARAERREALVPVRPLFRGEDHGATPIRIGRADLGFKDDRWLEPFLAANGETLRRLDIEPSVRVGPEARLELKTGGRIGAAPLLHPTTRKVSAGLLVEPRFRWPALGAVFSAIGYAVEPRLSSGVLVPGSQREVPPWIIAGPVLSRLEALLRHSPRGFVEVTEERSQPRGRVDWGAWARGGLARGDWTRLPCTFTDPQRDPDLMAGARWTLRRLTEDLARMRDSPIGRALHDQAGRLVASLGEGPARRPSAPAIAGQTPWIASAWEAMSWVAEERGLGGATVLDGLAWDLAVDRVWEAWVRTLGAALAPRLGLRLVPPEASRFPLHWRGRARSLTSLAPDVVMRGSDHVIVLEAKYKAHFALLARTRLEDQTEAVRAAHRADVHQALAYASLHDTDVTDVVIVYPRLGGEGPSETAVATMVAGRRTTRLWLMEVPFGFVTPDARSAQLERWIAALRAVG